MKGITDIFFDLDHTLWDFDKNSELTFETIFDKHKIDLPLKDFLDVYLPINKKYWKLFREGKIEQQNLRFQRLSEVFEVLKYQTSDQMINDLSQAYIDYLPNHNYLFPNTFDVLNYLQNNYKLHIITNGFYDVQHKKLGNSKLTPYFKTITTSEDAGVKKPNKIIFEYALDLAKTKNTNSIMIGDNLEADVEGAKASGLEAIFFGKEPTYEGLQIQNLNELKKLL
ncbi:MAG: YjjG family noncanonical pyrimidine nucleotidase [Psychroflexus sp.]